VDALSIGADIQLFNQDRLRSGSAEQMFGAE
jgi:hypothetical protein